MKYIDEAIIHVIAGKGGDGVAASAGKNTFRKAALPGAMADGEAAFSP